MKKLVFLTLIGLAATITTNAQKFGYVSSQELILAMPEARKADSSLNKYVMELENSLKTIYTELQTKQTDFEKNGASMSEVLRETKTKELQDLYSRLQEADQSAKEKIEKKRNELFTPITNKAREAIQAVGKEGGYDYIFEAGQLLYSKDTDNLLPKVKAKLGIK